MKTRIPKLKQLMVAGAVLALMASAPQSRALDSLTNGLAAYWPMDTIAGNVITPDLGPNGFDLQPFNNKVTTAFNGANITLASLGGPHANVNGNQNGTNAMVTSTGQSTTLGYIAPVTAVSQLTNLMVPPLNQPNWTISFWLKAPVSAANTGNRMFCIAEVPLGNGPNVLWDLTQNNQGDATQLGHFHRQAPSTINGIFFADDNVGGDQADTMAAGSPVPNVFDNNWHNITLIAQTITNASHPTIDGTQIGVNLVNGMATIAWNSISLDGRYPNWLSQVDTNQNYQVQRSYDLLNWTTISTQGSSGNGTVSTYNDLNITNNAFYRVQAPRFRIQTRLLYVDGQAMQTQTNLDYIDPLGAKGYLQALPEKNGSSYRTNGWQFADSFMFGGFVRAAGEGGFVNAQYSDAAVWTRALSTNDLAAFIQDGITNTSVFFVPPFANLTAEYPAAAQNDTDLLNWSASKLPGTLALYPGPIDVTPFSPQGKGNTNTTVTETTTYALVATKAGLSATGLVSVICVSNVAANWRYIDSYTYLNDGPIGGQGGWLNPFTGPATPTGMQDANVYTSGSGNNYMGFDGFYNDGADNLGNGALAGRALGSFQNTPGNQNTLFFRFYIPPAATNIDPYFNEVLPIQVTAGLTDLPLADVGFTASDVSGPCLQINQPVTGGGPIDLTCASGTAAAAAPAGIVVSSGAYHFLTDTNSGAGSTNGLTAGHVYSVWMDVSNSFPGVVGGFASVGEQTNAVIYRVWLQRDDWSQPTNLFGGITCTNVGGGIMNGTTYPTGWLVSPRDYSANNQNNTLLGPSPNLNKMYVQLDVDTANGINLQGTNYCRFDDFYISKSGLNINAPVAAGSFTP